MKEKSFSNVLPQVSLRIVHPDIILSWRISAFLLKMSYFPFFYNKKIPYYRRPIFVVPCNQRSILRPFALYYLPNRVMSNFLNSFFFFFFYLPQATRHHRLARAQKTVSDIFFTIKLHREEHGKYWRNMIKRNTQYSWLKHGVAAA